MAMGVATLLPHLAPKWVDSVKPPATMTALSTRFKGVFLELPAEPIADPTEA
jgi:hypothetical protein